jgi:hypothetical protein
MECHSNSMTVIKSTGSTSFVFKPGFVAPTVGEPARMAAGVSYPTFWSESRLPFQHVLGVFGSSNQTVRRDNSMVDSRDSRLPENTNTTCGSGWALAVLSTL